MPHSVMRSVAWPRGRSPCGFREVIDADDEVLVVVVDHVAKEALEIIETASVRCIWVPRGRGATADDRCVVAGILQNVWQQGDVL